MAKAIGLSQHEKASLFQTLANLLTGKEESMVRTSDDARHTGQMSLSDQSFTGKARSSIRLSQTEKDSIFQSVEQFMQAHPYRAHADAMEGSWSFFDFFRELKLMPVLASVLILVLGTGGTVSYAAQGALPGDTLYPIKIYVNEPMQSGFAFSSEAKARLETRLAQARLEEAEELALETRLDEAQATFLTERIRKHSEDARRHIALLNAKGQREIAADIDEKLHASLMAHDSALQKIAQSRKGSRKQIAQVIKGVRMASRRDDDEQVIAIAEVSAMVSEGLSSDRSSIPLALPEVIKQGASSSMIAPIIGVTDHKGEAKIDLVKSRIATVRSSLERKKKKGEVTVGSDSQGRINAAESALERAGIQLRAGSSSEADALRVESLQHAEEAELFIDIDAKLGDAPEQIEPVNVGARLMLKNAQKKLKDAWVALEHARTEGLISAENIAATQAVLEEAQKIQNDAVIKLDASLENESMDLSKASAKLIAQAQEALKAAKKAEEKIGEKVEDALHNGLKVR